MTQPTPPPFAVGTPFGTVFPARSKPGCPSGVDPRTIALRRLRDYVCALKFYLPGTPVREVFLNPKTQFTIEQPDHEQDLVFPSLTVLSGEADVSPMSMTTYYDETSFEKNGPGTVLQVQYEHVESITLEVWASSRAERRAFMQGLESAFNPVEEMSGFVLRMPDYYDETVIFMLIRKGILDDLDAAKNRRHGFVELEMRFNIVSLVNVNTLNPFVGVRMVP